MRMIALSRFTTNMKINSTRMSAWNLRSENNHMLTPIASVRPEKTMALPVCVKAWCATLWKQEQISFSAKLMILKILKLSLPTC